MRCSTFFPAAQPDAPLFVFIHGGYWQDLSQKDSSPMAPQVLKAGFAFATLNYTLAPYGTVELMVDQVARALGFLQKQARDLGFDPSRITLSGHSAGAHLAAMQVTLADPPFDLHGIAHVLLLSGIFDLDPIPLTSINDPLGLDAKRAHALSPMFLAPTARPRVTVAVCRARHRASSAARARISRCISAATASMPATSSFPIATISTSSSMSASRSEGWLFLRFGCIIRCDPPSALVCLADDIGGRACLMGCL